MRVMHLIFGLCLMLASLTVVAQEDPESTEVPLPPIEITIWWPDVIAHDGQGTINPLLIEQTDAFANQMPEVTFEHRLKAVGTTGGIMSTLRTANRAATGALPSLTLVRRNDLVTLQNLTYIQELEGISSTIIGDLDTALALGQIDTALYGLPYMLDVQHTVYRPTEDVSYDNWTFDAVLARNEPFIFPAGRANGINDVLLLQYIQAGGLATDNLIVAEEGLQSIFSFYEAATDAELITGLAVNATTYSWYREDFLAGAYQSGVFNSTSYLDMYAEDSSLQVAPIPTADGETVAFMEGWMWVMIAQDTEERRVATEYLNWMLSTERQSLLAQDIHMLPSRANARAFGLANDVPSDTYDELLENALIPVPDTAIGALGRAIQANFASILTLENSAEDSLEAILEFAD
ncbi:MAG: extracellular solute-binding protein [Chloroflexota bacterium]